MHEKALFLMYIKEIAEDYRIITDNYFHYMENKQTAGALLYIHL